MTVYPKCASLCYWKLVGKIIVGWNWTRYKMRSHSICIYVHLKHLPLSHHASAVIDVCAVVLVDAVCMNDSRLVQFVVYVNHKCIVDVEFDWSRSITKQALVGSGICHAEYVRPLIVDANHSSFMKAIWIHILVFKIPIIHHSLCQGRGERHGCCQDARQCSKVLHL